LQKNNSASCKNEIKFHLLTHYHSSDFEKVLENFEMITLNECGMMQLLTVDLVSNQITNEL